MKSWMLVGALAVGLLASEAVAQATPYIEFRGTMVGKFKWPGERWYWMTNFYGTDYYAWTHFTNCQFVATASNLQCLQGKDLSKLTLRSGVDGMRSHFLTSFEKTGDIKDHRVYTMGEFAIAYNGDKLVDGTADIELDVTYVPDHTAGGVNAHIDEFYNGPILSGHDLAEVFSSIEGKGHLWHAELLTLSETTVFFYDDWNSWRWWEYTYDTTIRLTAQTVGRDVGVVQPSIGITENLGDTGIALRCRTISDAGGGAVTAIQKLAQPAGGLPPDLNMNTVSQHWAIGTTMLGFNADLALAYDTNVIRNADQLRVYRRLSSTSPWLAVPITDVSAGYVTVTNVTHFSEWVVGAVQASNDPVLPSDLPVEISLQDRQMYRNWIATNKMAWGAHDFGTVPANDFLAAWLVGREPQTGFADGVALSITGFERVATQPAETNRPPMAWRLGAAKPDVTRVKLRLTVDGQPWNGPVNGNVVIQSTDALGGTWSSAVGQTDAEQRLSFVNGAADLIFNRPAGAAFYRPLLARQGRAGATGRISTWGTASTNQWVTCTVDNLPTNGLFASIAYNAAGVLGVSYYDATEGDLKYASYSNGTLRVERVDTEGDVGQHCDLAFTPAGQPAISYLDATRYCLKYAVRGAAGGWTVATVDASPYCGEFTSLAFMTNGNPAISYKGYKSGKDNLKYAFYTGASWSNQVADSYNYCGFHSSLAFTTNNRPAIAHVEDYGWSVRYTEFNGTTWTSSDTYLDNASDLSLSFTNGRPCIAANDRFEGKIKYASYYPIAGVHHWYSENVDTAGGDYYRSGVCQALAPDRRPALCYYDANACDLKYAKLTGAAWVRETIDTAGDVGQYAEMAFSPSGRPAIAYFDATSGKLKVAESVPIMRVNE